MVFSPSSLCFCYKQISLCQLKAIHVHKIKRSYLVASHIRGFTLWWWGQGMYNTVFLFWPDYKISDMYSTIWMPSARNIKLCVFKQRWNYGQKLNWLTCFRETAENYRGIKVFWITVNWNWTEVRARTSRRPTFVFIHKRYKFQSNTKIYYTKFITQIIFPLGSQNAL